MNLSLTNRELLLLLDALDSHEYWQLTEQSDRNDGCSLVEDGSDPAIDQCRKLYRRLERLRPREKSA